MRILTVKQPYAAAIACGLKRIENRKLSTAYRGRVLIHAGLNASFVKESPNLIPELGDDPLDYGAIIAVVDLIDCQPLDDVTPQRFASGPWCWILANAFRLPRPVPARGQLSLFRPTDEIVAAVLNQLPRA